jgi:hypothetical protein
MTTTAKEAANRLLECIVYHDLANRRGEAVADAIINELASIADAAPGPERIKLSGIWSSSENANHAAPDVQIEFLLSVTKDDEATIQRLEADLKESCEYALALEKELRDRANLQLSWGPPTAEHREGFECLAENSYGIWRHAKWINGRWMVRGTFNEIEPTDLAPLPNAKGKKS